jgi:hypothetical protein
MCFRFKRGKVVRSFPINREGGASPKWLGLPINRETTKDLPDLGSEKSLSGGWCITEAVRTPDKSGNYETRC